MIRSVVAATVLFALNAAVAWPLFRLGYGSFLGSAEGVFISLARYMRDNAGDLAWFPLWRSGMPFSYVYPPGLHALVAAVSRLLSMDVAQAYHAVTAALYCLGPVSLFVLCRAFGRSRAVAFAVGLVYTVLSPSAFLSSHIRLDNTSAFNQRRLFSLIAWGDGPHIAALTLLPLSLAALHLAVSRRDARWMALAAPALALVPLTNWPAAVALAFAAAAYLMSVGGSELPRAAAYCSAAAVLGWGLVLPWLPLSAVLQTLRNAPATTTTQGDFASHAASAPVLILAVAGLFAVAWLVRRRTESVSQRFGLLWMVMLGGVTFGWYWFGIALLPQPFRFHLAFEMAFALAVVPPLAHAAFRRRFIALTAAAGLAGFAAVQLLQHARYLRTRTAPIDIGATVEYRMARWFDTHMQGRRVFAPGSVALWMNVWTDTPQWTGCCEQSAVHRIDTLGEYFVRTGGPGTPAPDEWSILWLRAYGVHAVGVGGRRGREHYKYMQRPDLLRGLLREGWREGDDFVLEVPHRSRSLARVVRRRDLVTRTPLSGADVGPLQPYVAALEDASLPSADALWLGRSRLRASAVLQPDHVLSFHITWHEGWSATVNGSPVPVHRDGLGQIWLEPRCSGRCLVHLTF